jgi:hypothetical protein
MFWSLSLQLMPEETVLEDSTKHPVKGIKPAYSVFLTNKRVVFRFDGLGSSMTQSFLYHEITEAKPSTRMMITYLGVKTGQKEHFLHIAEPEYWAGKILEVKKGLPEASGSRTEADARIKKQELLTMLSVLHKNNILTAAEFDQKKKLVESVNA